MKYIIDSDFLFGLFVTHDPHHRKTSLVLNKIIKLKAKIISLNLVIHETATVLSKKGSQNTAMVFLDKVSKMPIEIIDLNREIENLAWKIFKNQIKKGTSFIDCANLAVCQKYKLDGILSFDEFYPKELLLK